MGVATIYGEDWEGTMDSASRMLRVRHIPVLVGAGDKYRGWGVFVHERDREKALRILERDAKQHHYRIPAAP